MTLVRACQSHAKFRSANLATIDGPTGQTWLEFVERISRAAAGLMGQGVKNGDRVGILALNSADYLALQVAVWSIGAVVVPMNIRWSTDENLYSARDSGMTLLAADATFGAAALAVQASLTEIKLISFDPDARTPFGTFERLVAEHEPVDAIEASSRELAGIYYTGGTTGFPKGAMLTHEALVAASLGLLSTLRADDSSRALHAAPMFHLADGALCHAMLLLGACNIYIPRFEAGATMDAVERYGVTHTLLVPTMIGLLLSDPSYEPQRLSSLEALLFGASPMNASLLAQLQSDLAHLRPIHCYDQTEMGPLVSFLDPRHQRAGDPKALSIGKPFPAVDVRIVDDEGAEAPIGQPGEILARGPNMMRGYWNKPDETAAAMSGNWIRTGDVAFRDADGFMFTCDRAKDMIITGGENVFSAEVENAIAAHPAVAQVAVIGIPDPDYGERVHAVIVTRTGETIDQAALHAHCRPLIANYKCPRSMNLRAELPISGAGKILKRDLREPYWQGHARGVN